jgi:Leucine-rich repeat (LRR) protein
LITISHNLLTGDVPLELALLDDLNIEMEGNKLTNLDARFCENLSWMNGSISNYGCDALMCRPGYFSINGRQNSTDSACKQCDVNANSDPAPFWGSISCDGLVDDREILELLYSDTKGDDWHNNENWLTTDDICSWYGVECRDGVSVQAIRLGANNLVGTPPKEIFLLKQLHTLWLHSNPIFFKFEGIDKAQNLIDLRLDATGLSDSYGVGKAKNLIKLDLKYNQISGKFPVELLDLEKLESLSLTDNRLVRCNLQNYSLTLLLFIHLMIHPIFLTPA